MDCQHNPVPIPYSTSRMPSRIKADFTGTVTAGFNSCACSGAVLYVCSPTSDGRWLKTMARRVFKLQGTQDRRTNDDQSPKSTPWVQAKRTIFFCPKMNSVGHERTNSSAARGESTWFGGKDQDRRDDQDAATSGPTSSKADSHSKRRGCEGT